MDTSFQRARSSEAKLQREMAIFDAARLLAGQHGVREVTLSDIAGAVGMHKSALLRYFETREQIFLILTAEEWRAWSNIVQEALVTLKPAAPASVAAVLANSLTLHPLFCDLLAQAPMNLERNVSIQAVRSFKLVVLHEVRAVASALERLLGINAQQALDALTTATSMAGALWQMATPGNEVQTLYRSDPQLAHAVVDVRPRLTHRAALQPQRWRRRRRQEVPPGRGADSKVEHRMRCGGPCPFLRDHCPLRQARSR